MREGGQVSKMKTEDPAVARRRRFGEALGEAMGVRRVTQKDLGALLGGVSQPAISAWISGDAEPNPATVFEVERVLQLPPGGLAKILGYLPTAAVAVTTGFEAVVMGDPLLDERSKSGLLAMYRELTGRRRSTTPKARTRKG